MKFSSKGNKPRDTSSESIEMYSGIANQIIDIADSSDNDFYSDLASTASSILIDIEEKGGISEPQKTALINMLESMKD
jgi:hypothetical protein